MDDENNNRKGLKRNRPSSKQDASSSLAVHTANELIELKQATEQQNQLLAEHTRLLKITPEEIKEKLRRGKTVDEKNQRLKNTAKRKATFVKKKRMEREKAHTASKEQLETGPVEQEVIEKQTRFSIFRRRILDKSEVIRTLIFLFICASLFGGARLIDTAILGDEPVMLEIGHLSRDELTQYYLSHGYTGVPTPPPDATNDQWRQYSENFNIYCVFHPTSPGGGWVLGAYVLAVIASLVSFFILFKRDDVLPKILIVLARILMRFFELVAMALVIGIGYHAVKESLEKKRRNPYR